MECHMQVYTQPLYANPFGSIKGSESSLVLLLLPPCGHWVTFAKRFKTCQSS